MLKEVVGYLKGIGQTDEINTCDCCGKQGLKKTIIMVMVSPETGEQEEYGYFGTTCASVASGRPVKDIMDEVREAEKLKEVEAQKKEEEEFVLNLMNNLENVPTPIKKDSNVRYKVVMSWIESFVPSHISKSKMVKFVDKKVYQHKICDQLVFIISERERK